MGRLKPITFSTEVFTLRDSVEGFPDAGRLGIPVYSNSAGSQVWFLHDQELKAFRKQLDSLPGVENIIGARVTTANGICATLFSGQSVVVAGVTNQVGLQTQYYANTRHKRTDLFLGAIFSELMTNKLPSGVAGFYVRTNLDFAARLQVPMGRGVVLLTRSGKGENAKPAGMVIDAP